MKDIKKEFIVTGATGGLSSSIMNLVDWKAERELYGLDIKKYTPYMDEFQETSIVPAYVNVSYQRYMEE